MILVIPSIQLINGECGDEISGFSAECGVYDIFKKSPQDLIKLWRRENAKTIHINNVDSFLNLDHSQNLDIINNFSSLTEIPISLFHYYKNIDTCESLLKSEIYRVFIGTMLFDDIKNSKELVQKYTTSRICANLLTDGTDAIFLNNNTKVPVKEVLEIFKEIGIHRILYNCTYPLNEITLEEIKKISKINKDFNFKISLNCGAIHPKDLWLLNENAGYGIDSVIVGRALYQNNFPCQMIWRLVEEELEPEILKSSK